MNDLSSLFPKLPVFDSLKEIAIDYTVYLTGSRYFLTNKPQADWDFFAEYDPTLLNKLRDLDFASYDKTHTKYNDPSIKMVLTYPQQTEEDYELDGTGVIKILCPKVDIQIIRPEWMTAKEETQKYLATIYDYKTWHKDRQRDIWEAMLPAMKLLHSDSDYTY